jgi:hypothetical protein
MKKMSFILLLACLFVACKKNTAIVGNNSAEAATNSPTTGVSPEEVDFICLDEYEPCNNTSSFCPSVIPLTMSLPYTLNNTFLKVNRLHYSDTDRWRIIPAPLPEGGLLHISIVPGLSSFFKKPVFSLTLNSFYNSHFITYTPTTVKFDTKLGTATFTNGNNIFISSASVDANGTCHINLDAYTASTNIYSFTLNNSAENAAGNNVAFCYKIYYEYQ